MVIIVCGVSGSGKTTVGKMLSERLGCEFLDADDYHPAENIRKMAAGEPLTDSDRRGWLDTLGAMIDGRLRAGTDAVLACSALKVSYRVHLRRSPDVTFFLLDANFDLANKRLKDRKHHFFSPSLLQDQYDILERSADLVAVRADRPTDEIVADILERLPEPNG